MGAKTRRLLLVGWEAADWRILHPLLDAGELPALRRIVERGVSGRLLGTQPLVAAAQWTSLATGKRPWQHRVCHAWEWASEAARAVPVSAAARRSVALWEMLARQGRQSVVVGWPATHGGRLENLRLVSDRYAQPTAGPGLHPWPPAAPGTYWPEDLGTLLDERRMSPAQVNSKLIARFVPHWKRIDQKRDRRLGQLRVLLAADFSNQAAMMSVLARGDWEFAAVCFPALGALSRMFPGYHAPQPNHGAQPEAALYCEVIRAAYRMLDQMLGKLVQAADEDAAVVVVSPHGLGSTPLPNARSGAEEAGEWQSPRGILAACGPGWAADALVLGASVLDLAPTLLTWFGLPMGDDMEGRVLVEAFVQAPVVNRVPSWEAASPQPASAAAGAVKKSEAAARLQREWDWNLAQSCLEATRYDDALPLLERLFRSFPERPDWGHALFQCQLRVRRVAEAAETLEVMLEGLAPGVGWLLPQAEFELARGQTRHARQLVEQVQALQPTHPRELRRLGLLLWRLRDWEGLAALAGKALQFDEQDALAWLGLAKAQFRKGLVAQAEQAALRAIGLDYYLPEAHLVLARALMVQGQWHPARNALQIVLQLQPTNRAATAYAKRVAGFNFRP